MENTSESQDPAENRAQKWNVVLCCGSFRAPKSKDIFELSVPSSLRPRNRAVAPYFVVGYCDLFTEWTCIGGGPRRRRKKEAEEEKKKRTKEKTKGIKWAKTEGTQWKRIGGCPRRSRKKKRRRRRKKRRRRRWEETKVSNKVEEKQEGQEERVTDKQTDTSRASKPWKEISLSEHGFEFTVFFRSCPSLRCLGPRDSKNTTRWRTESLPNRIARYEKPGKKKEHKHELFGPNFLRTFPTLTLGCPGIKTFSPSPGPQKKALFGADIHDFRRGRPWPEGLSKNFVQKKFALIFWPLLKNLKLWKKKTSKDISDSNVFWGCGFESCDFKSLRTDGDSIAANRERRFETSKVWDDRPTLEPQAEQYPDTVLVHPAAKGGGKRG